MEDKDFLGQVLKEKSPTVIYTCNRWRQDSKSPPFLRILNGLKDQRLIVLMGIWWTVDPRYGNPGVLCSWIKGLMSQYPNLLIIACANTAEEYEAIQSEGVKVILANQNMLIDERYYFPIDNQEIRYDAIYNAQFLPFKRHELLEEVDSLALIGYNLNADERYMKKIARVLERATILNYDDNKKPKFLTKEQCNLAYSMSGAGLCLSKVEGAMYASMEYLMSGLMVISTASAGGRNYYLNSGNSLIVADDPLEIKQAIKEAKAMKFDRNQIRSDVLKKVQSERQRFISEVDRMIENESGEKDHLLNHWDSIFVNKLLQDLSSAELVRRCKLHEFPV